MSERRCSSLARFAWTGCVGALLRPCSHPFIISCKAAGLEESAVLLGAKELVEVGGTADEFIGDISILN